MKLSEGFLFVALAIGSGMMFSDTAQPTPASADVALEQPVKEWSPEPSPEPVRSVPAGIQKQLEDLKQQIEGVSCQIEELPVCKCDLPSSPQASNVIPRPVETKATAYIEPMITTPDGESQTVEEFIGQHYYRAWNFGGDTDHRKHLGEGDHNGFSIAGLDQLSDNDVERLHAAEHEWLLKQKPAEKPVTVSTVTYKTPTTQVYYQQPTTTKRRSGLFGRRKTYCVNGRCY